MSDTPPSPCIGECVLNRQGYCVGCGRTVDEIATWPGMTAAEREAVLSAIRARGARRA